MEKKHRDDDSLLLILFVAHFIRMRKFRIFVASIDGETDAERSTKNYFFQPENLNMYTLPI